MEDFKPVLTCRACGHSGTNYSTAQRANNLSCWCGNCGTWIKHLSKTNKYRTVEKKEIVMRKTQGRCGYCGCGITPNDATVDHITPQAKGGTHHPANLLAACKSCNSQKGKKTLEEYRGYILRTTGRRAPFYFETISDLNAGL
jgi:5-methylcytosine-specific restriction endonuclease McrA